MIAAEGRDFTVNLPLIGAYQAANALVSAGLVIATGGDVAATLAHLARVQPVRGRLERAVIARSGAPVYVDYAHTPDALEAAAAALRPHTKGRLILVFGAGGDRDQGKRPLMGAAAVAIADHGDRHRRQSAFRRPVGDPRGDHGGGTRRHAKLPTVAARLPRQLPRAAPMMSC